MHARPTVVLLILAKTEESTGGSSEMSARSSTISLLAVAIWTGALALGPACSAFCNSGGSRSVYRVDPHRTGRSPYKGTQTPIVAWKLQTGDFVRTSPAFGADGNAYVGSGDGKIYSVRPDGSVAWTYTTGGMILSSPAVGNDGTIYAASIDGRLYAINPDGTTKWRLSSDCVPASPLSSFYSSPVIRADGVIALASLNGWVLAADESSGALQWAKSLSSYTYSSLAAADDGTMYIGATNGMLTALRADGSTKWQYQTNGWVGSVPAIGDDGTIYVTSCNGRLTALTPDGHLKWSYLATAGASLTSPAITIAGSVCFGSSDGFLHMVGANGYKEWIADVRSPIASSPTIDAEGNIYFGTDGGMLRSLTPAGKWRWDLSLGAQVRSSPVISESGAVYVGTEDDYLYAIGATTTSPPVPEPATLVQLACALACGGLTCVRRRRV